LRGAGAHQNGEAAPHSLTARTPLIGSYTAGRADTFGSERYLVPFLDWLSFSKASIIRTMAF
jgi:hypothetical protein